MSVQILRGDCLDRMRELDACSIDAVVTDPPYHLMAHKRGGTGDASVNLKMPHGRARIGAGFMNQKWDGGDVAFRAETWSEAMRVLKPGGMLVAFGGTRTFHRLVTPKGGLILDPFMGSGSTLKAAELEGFSAIGIELNAEYIEIARRRIAGDMPLFAEVAA